MSVFATDDLTRLCRVCLGEGEINLFEHMIQLPPDVEEPEVLEEHVSAHEMFSVFSKEQFTELEGDATIDQLICNYCLDELISSFLFFRKVERASRRLAEHYASSKTTSASTISDEFIEYIEEEAEPFICAVPEEKNVQELKLDLNEKNNNRIFHSNSKTSFEAVRFSQHLAGQKRRKVARNPTFVLTDGVSQILAHVNPSSIASSDDIFTVPMPTDTPTPQKRLKTRDKPKLGYGSFVVTQFIPSSEPVKLYRTNYEGSDQHQYDGTSNGNKLRTMDYAAVEIEGDASELVINDTGTLLSKVSSNGFADEPPAIYVCKYCSPAFTSACYLMTHIRKRHVCKFCTQAFSRTTDLFEHIRSSHTERKCAICGNQQSSRSNLRNHIKRAQGVKLPPKMALLM